MFGSLSMWEILLILVIALLVFGPRKLPQLGRTLGESLAQFRRASDDFRRSWDQEVILEEKRMQTTSPAPNAASTENEQPSAPEN